MQIWRKVSFFKENFRIFLLFIKIFFYAKNIKHSERKGFRCMYILLRKTESPQRCPDASTNLILLCMFFFFVFSMWQICVHYSFKASELFQFRIQFVHLYTSANISFHPWGLYLIPVLDYFLYPVFITFSCFLPLFLSGKLRADQYPC